MSHRVLSRSWLSHSVMKSDIPYHVLVFDIVNLAQPVWPRIYNVAWFRVAKATPS